MVHKYLCVFERAALKTLSYGAVFLSFRDILSNNYKYIEKILKFSLTENVFSSIMVSKITKTYSTYNNFSSG